MTTTMAITMMTTTTMTTTMTTTIAMTMATMVVNDYGYNGDDGNDDDDDDDDDEDANLLRGESIVWSTPNRSSCMQELTDSHWCWGSPTIADAGAVPLNGLASEGVDAAEGIVDVR